ncbi:MAG: hypothetical protein U0175_13500 [Caldilineaceae bacterium]
MHVGADAEQDRYIRQRLQNMEPAWRVSDVTKAQGLVSGTELVNWLQVL